MLMPMLRYPFPHIANFRDLGGLPAENGGTTRWGAFYRCADLCNATHAERDFLYSQMNIRTIIDLRAPMEVTAAPDPFMDDSRFYWMNHSLIGNIGFDELGINYIEANTPTMVNFYKLLLQRCPGEMKTLMELLEEGTKRGAVLFHCSAGKDRTGITAMFLLSLCGAEDKDIIAQYEISRTLLMDYRMEDRSGSHYSNMEGLLVFLKEQYKTPAGYLRQTGVSQTTLDALKAALYVPGKGDANGGAFPFNAG